MQGGHGGGNVSKEVALWSLLPPRLFEELVGAAISSCYSMFLSALLTNNEFKNKEIKTQATVTLERDDTGPVITRISLDVSADVEGITNEQFQGFVNEALAKCPISRLYATVQKTVTAKLLTASN